MRVYIDQSTFPQLNHTTPAAEWSYVHVDCCYAVVILCVRWPQRAQKKKYRSNVVRLSFTFPTDNYPCLLLLLSFPRVSFPIEFAALLLTSASASHLKCRLRATRRDSRNKKGDVLSVACLVPIERKCVMPMLTVLVSRCPAFLYNIPSLYNVDRMLSLPYIYIYVEELLLFRWIFSSSFHFRFYFLWIFLNDTSSFRGATAALDTHTQYVLFYHCAPLRRRRPSRNRPCILIRPAAEWSTHVPVAF